MAFFKNNPFIKLLLPLLAGIIFQNYFNISNIYLQPVFAILFVICVIIHFIKFSYTKSYYQGIIISFFIFCLGMVLLSSKKSPADINTKINSITLIGKLENVPVERENNFKLEIWVEAQKENNIWKETGVKIVAFVEKEQRVKELKAGNKIIFKAEIIKFNAAGNPFGFDYARYLELKQISRNIYLSKDSWLLFDEEEQGIRNRALNTRQKLINVFKLNGIEGENLAILSALTLGYKNKLDEKVRAAYSGAGAMHVLAVSGLHVGIIYLVLSFLFSWLKLFCRIKKAKYLIILLALWAYAFVTGLSPSVLRASLMFSFVLFGNLIDKRINIYNSLSASAFLLLLVNPYFLFELSFQLSYIAVTGIVFFQPRIYSIVYFKHKLLRWIWSVTAVSVAAQLATFPLTIFNFHQFPVYFWLSNIWVTVMAFVLMLLAIILIIISPFASLSSLLGVFINYLLSANQGFINWINNLPGAIINNISLQSVQLVIIYCMLFTITLWLISKKYVPLILGLSFMLLLGMYNLFDNQKRQDQTALCVYHLRSGTGIQFVDRNVSNWLFSEQADTNEIKLLVNNGNLYWRTSQNSAYRMNNMADSTVRFKNWYFKNGFWALNNTRGLIIQSNSKLPEMPKDSIILDYLVITGNPSFGLADLPAKIVYKQVVIDGSVPTWKLTEFKNFINNANLFMTKKQGAFIATNNI